ncbi:MAG: ribosomal L7Ae/L30e/S12e/Gadd45 family protein [Eubacteriales bacterium]|nr:ribosomal L7Ae/L30e/S12e/Gadd45 family protein [Eubacteriales bacterium]
MTQRDRTLSLLGLAAKAGKIESGELSTEKAVKKGRGRLVIVAEDASDNTKKMFRNMCKYYEVPYVEFGTKEELGHWIGRAYRASICILEEGFAKAVLKKMNLNMEV